MKIIFVVTTAEEAKLSNSIYQELVAMGIYEVVNIGTGMLCCDDNSQQPEAMVKQLGMKGISLLDFKTRNIANVLEREYPDLVVTGSDQEYIRRAFLYAADGLKIPTLMLLVGASSNASNNLRVATKRTVYRAKHHLFNILNKYAYLMRTVVALGWSPLRIMKMVVRDFIVAFTMYDARCLFGYRPIAVSGLWEKQMLVSRGVEPNRIIIVGNPLIISVEQTNGHDIRKRFGIGGNHKVVLLLTCSQVEHGRWTKDMRRRFVLGVVDAISPLLSGIVHLIIKIHPVERQRDYEEILDGGEHQVILCQDLPLADIVSASDVVLVGGYSTTVLEASALGKPVLLLNLFNENRDLAYVEMGLAVEVNEISDVRGVVEKLLYTQSAREEMLSKSRKFYEENKEFVDGKAAERISGLILKLVEVKDEGNSYA